MFGEPENMGREIRIVYAFTYAERRLLPERSARGNQAPCSAIFGSDE